jgi:hypothetical protein
MQRIILIICAFLIFLPLRAALGMGTGPERAAVSEKPASAVDVSISTEEGASSLPGGAVALRVTVRSSVASERLRVTIRARGGAEVLEGETSWTGPIQRGGERAFVVLVRPSEKGKGAIVARASIKGGKGRPSYSGSAIHRFGPEEDEPVEEGRTLRDSRGRDIIEYRER